MESPATKATTDNLETLRRIRDALRECQGIGVFDFDGVIANTEPLHAQAYTMLLAEYGVHFDEAQFQKYIGHTEVEIYSLLERVYAIRMDIRKDKAKRLQYFKRLVLESDLSLSMVVRSILDDDSIPFYILSAQDAQLIHELLVHWCVRDRFTVMQPSDEYPEKSVLLAALPILLNVASSRIFYFEDSLAFINQGHHEGYRTVFVQHALNSSEHAQADWIVDV